MHGGDRNGQRRDVTLRVDAVSRLWQLLRVTLLARPWIPALLMLFYVVGLFVAAGPASDDLWLGVAALFAFPTACIVGIVTERVGLLCESAGALGVPRHAESVRLFQLLTLSTVALPVSFAAVIGGNVLATAAILCGAAVLGTWLPSRPSLIVVVIVTALLLREFADWLANVYVQASFVLLGLYELMRWLRRPFDVAAAGAQRVSAFADARHEDDAEVGDETEPPEYMPEREDAETVEGRDLEAYAAALDRAVARYAYRPGYRATAENLGFALGFDVVPHVRAKLVWTAIACVVVLVTYFVRDGNSAMTAYGIVLFCASIISFSKASSLYDVWRRAQGEQSLLHLAPFWPRAIAWKPALTKAAAESLTGAWLVWLATTLLTLALGSIVVADAVTSAVAMLAVSTATVGNLLWILSRPKRADWRLSTVLTFGAPAIGALGVALRHLGTPLFVAFALIVLPLLVGGLLFRRRSLPFPANVVR